MILTHLIFYYCHVGKGEKEERRGKGSLEMVSLRWKVKKIIKIITQTKI